MRQQSLFRVVSKSGSSIAVVWESTAKEMAEEINGSYEPFDTPSSTPNPVPSPRREVVHETESYRAVRETTPWGTKTTRRIQKPKSSQTDFLRLLLQERQGNPQAEAIRATLNRAKQDGTLNKAIVSDAITQLQKLPRYTQNQSTSAPQMRSGVDVPAGHYALESEGVLKFYKVDKPTEGKWAGHTFVKAIAGPDEYPIRNRDARNQILVTIEKDVVGCMVRYGKEIGRCGRCNRRLTDAESRAYGIGPECRSKM